MDTNKMTKKIGKISGYSRHIRWMVLISIIVHMLILHLILPEDSETRDSPEPPHPTMVDISVYHPIPTPPPEISPRPTPRRTRTSNHIPKPVPQALTPDEIPTPPAAFTPEIDLPLPDFPGDVDFVPEPVTKRIYLPSEVDPPVTIHRVEPVYPAVCRRLGVQGMVVLEAVIGKDGKPRDIKVLRSLNEMCNREAVRALEQWEFTPGTLNGTPVDVLLQLVIWFNLNA